MGEIFFGTNWLPAVVIVLCQLLYLIPALYVAWRLAALLEPYSAVTRLFLTGIHLFLLGVAAIGLTGALHLLNAGVMLFLLWSLAAIAFAVTKERGIGCSSGRMEPASLVAVTLAAGYLLFGADIAATMPTVGTDAMLYHFFYPVSWIAQGSIDRIPQQGLVTAAYACYGELFNTFFYLPAGNEFFVRSVPFFILITGMLGCFAAARALKLSPAAGGAATLLLAGCESFYANAVVANTDVLLGVELLSAAVLALLAVRRNRPCFWLLAGAVLGCAPATKLLGILLSPFLYLAVVLPLAVTNWRHYRKNLALYTLAAAVTASPYYLVNWFVTGSPAYPQKITLFGRPLWNAYLVTGSAPPVGLSARTWGYFVGNGGMRTPFITVLVLLVTLTGGLLTLAYLIRRQRTARPGRIILGTLALLLPVMIVIQCLIYPARTQPRQIIPILMLTGLAALPCWHSAAKWRRGWCVTLAAVLLTVLGAWGRLRHLPWVPDFSLFLAVLATLLFLHWKLQKKHRLLLWSLPLAAVILLSAYRFAQSNASRKTLMKCYLSPESFRAIELLHRLDPEERGLTIAYTGIHYGFYTGISGRNKVRSVPVSKSGLAGAWHYRTFEEEREDGGFDCYLARLRQGGFHYLLCEPHHFDAPRPDLEVKWALAHPQELPLLYHEGNLWLFRVTEAGQ